MIEETISVIIKNVYSNVYIGDAPLEVNDCVWIKAASGRPEVYFDKDTYDYPNYIVYARGVNNKDAKDVIEKVYHALHMYVGTNFVILAKQLPVYSGRDQKHRAHYSFRIEYQLGGY